jgi:signal transduction histidine kinase
VITPWHRQGIRWRIGMMYLSTFAVGLVVFCTLLFQYFQRMQIKAFDVTLYNFAVDISSNLEMDFVGRLFVVNPGAAEEGKLFPFHLGGSFLEIRDTKGKILRHSKSLDNTQLPFDKSTLDSALKDRAVFRTVKSSTYSLKSQSPELRLISFLAFREGWVQPLILQIAVPMDLPRQERRDLLMFFGFGVPLFLVLAGFVGFIISKTALRPVREMTRKASGISGVGNLSERIPVPTASDEIQDLAVTFNGLLDRLEKAFVSQDRFVSNASHQLKTPLTILKGELEMFSKSEAKPENLKAFLESSRIEINRMIRLVEELLLLARLEAGKDTLTMGTVRLDEVLLNVVSRIQKLAEKKSVSIKTGFQSERKDQELEVQTRGDEELIAAMLENFIENAVKYSPSNTLIEVQLRSEKNNIVVTVSDQGGGIPEESRQKIFERFHRVHPSSIVPGSGLGLAIAAEIARLHGVVIELTGNSANGRGTRIQMTFQRLMV